MPQKENDRGIIYTLVVEAYCCICDKLIETKRMQILVSVPLPEFAPDTDDWCTVSIRGENHWITETYRGCPKHTLQDLIDYVSGNKIKRK